MFDRTPDETVRWIVLLSQLYEAGFGFPGTGRSLGVCFSVCTLRWCVCLAVSRIKFKFGTNPFPIERYLEGPGGGLARHDRGLLDWRGRRVWGREFERCECGGHRYRHGPNYPAHESHHFTGLSVEVKKQKAENNGV